MKKFLIFLFVVVVVVGGIMAFSQYRSRQNQESMLADLKTIRMELGSLVSTIGATGKVRSNQSAQLAWQTTGTVGQVNVTVGEKVSNGQELASLEQTSLPQSVILAQADLVSAQKALDDLYDFQLQQALALGAVEDAEQALEDVFDVELSLAIALEAIAEAEKAVEDAERRLRNLQSIAGQSTIDAAEAQVVLAKDALDKAQENYEPYGNKPEDNLTRANLQSKLAEAQQLYDAAVRNLNSLQSPGSEIDIAIAEADLATVKVQLTEAQREYEEAKDGPSEAEAVLLEAQLEDAKSEWERIKDGPEPSDIAVAEARVSAAQATLNQVHITAPFDGVLTGVTSKPGDQVQPGVVAFRLDDLSRLLVDVEVSEVDINQIVSGQAVDLAFDAILDQEFHGVVVEVASVGSEFQGVVNFKVTVELSDAGEDVKPGMTAAVNIVVNQLEDVLLVPNRAVRVREGARIVYILNSSNNPQPIEITLGASSDAYSEVINTELQVGDRVILNPPSTFIEDNFGPQRGGMGGGRMGGGPP